MSNTPANEELRSRLESWKEIAAYLNGMSVKFSPDGARLAYNWFNPG